MKTLLLSIVAVSSLMFSCSTKSKEITQTMEDIKDAFTLEKQEVHITLNLPAELLPYERAEINAKIEGYVQKVLVDLGDTVNKGQNLAILDAPEIAAQLAEANSRLLSAKAKYLASLDKYNRIFSASRQSGVVAEAELINFKQQMLADSAAFSSANSMVQSYRQLWTYLTIRAPFNGVVTSRSIDPGDFVGGNSGKQAMFIIERPDKLRLRIYVPEMHVNNIPAEKSLQFTAESVLNKTFAARLARKSGSIDSDTRTELWEYEFDNINRDLKPGMYVMAKLQLNRPTATFVVPHSALVTTLEKKFVARVNGDKMIEWVDVRSGISQGNGIEIFGDLKEGDTLLTRGSDEIKPGTAVKVNIKNYLSEAQ